MKHWYVYIIELSDSSLYTGITNDVQRRMRMHQNGKGSKYVRSRLPLTLVYLMQCDSRSSASKVERRIKNMKKYQKVTLINGSTNVLWNNK